MPNPTLACSSTACTGSVESSTLVAAAATSWASARPRAACRARSALRSTTDATVTPTTTKTTRAKAFSGSVMVKEPNGGVNRKFASKPAITAATAAGRTPPISALAEHAEQEDQQHGAQAEAVPPGQQQRGQHDGQQHRGRPRPEPARPSAVPRPRPR